MKKFLSKNTTIGLLVLTNAIAATLVVVKLSNSGTRQKAAAELKAAPMPPPKTAIVKGATNNPSNDLQPCYEAFLANEPQVSEGVVEVHWMLDPKGKISSLSLVKSDLNDKDFLGCILDKIGKMNFKAPPKARPTLVSHKFKFHQRSPASLRFQ